MQQQKYSTAKRCNYKKMQLQKDATTKRCNYKMMQLQKDATAQSIAKGCYSKKRQQQKDGFTKSVGLIRVQVFDTKIYSPRLCENFNNRDYRIECTYIRIFANILQYMRKIVNFSHGYLQTCVDTFAAGIPPYKYLQISSSSHGYSAVCKGGEKKPIKLSHGYLPIFCRHVGKLP